MPPQMKGLSQFIADLRNSKDSEEEKKRINLEINNIQTKFSNSKSLNGYQRKKYICKLMYIYLLGNDVSIGIRESTELISSNVYSEKQVGYLAISIMCNEDSELLAIVSHSVAKDLQADNEDTVCLALQFLSNIGHTKWFQQGELVYHLCSSPLASPLVKKKACLALLKLFKSDHALLLDNHIWIPKLLALIDHEDLGVVTSATSLVEFMLHLKPEQCKPIIISVANKLYSLVIDESCAPEYYYYDIPAPWLHIKLLHLIEEIFSVNDPQHPDQQLVSVDDLDPGSTAKLRKVVVKSIKNASKPAKGIQNRNSQNGILFQSISLAVFLDASSEVINDTITVLISLLSSLETNTRYLSLDALIKWLIKLNSRGGTVAVATTNKNIMTLFQLLKDKDISVRRKALDLLYTICDTTTLYTIVGELLNYFPYADYNLRPEIAVKVAVLAERFATDTTWYVVTILKLVSLAGNHIGAEVWERVIQIIVNNEELQKTACKLLISLLGKSDNPSESLVKVAAFILGEFGDIISQDTEDKLFKPEMQFKILYEKYFYCSLPTRAMILSTFLKFAMKFPDLLPQVLDFFELEQNSIDLEVQQRSIEYIKLLTREDDNLLLKTVVQDFPVFETKINPLLARLGSVNQIMKRANNSALSLGGKVNRSSSSFNSNGDTQTTGQDSDNPFEETTSNKKEETVTLSPNWSEGYHRMMHFDAGIFYESSLIRIVYRVSKQKNQIKFQLNFINKSPANISALFVSVKSMTKREDPNYITRISQLPDSSILQNEKSSLEFVTTVRNILQNNETPILEVSFVCGSYVSLKLKIPVILIKTLNSAELPAAEFERRWIQIGQLKEEGESVVDITTLHRHNSQSIHRLLSRLGFSIVPNDNADNEILGAAILHTLRSNYGVLVKLTMDAEGRDFSLWIRCTGGGIAEIISSNINELFKNGF